jgi:fluoride ion exporter CrcB/FEX
MKKLLLASVFVAFAVAVQAGDAKTSKESKDQKAAVKADTGCCSAKTSTSTVTKTSITAVEKEKMGCCGGGGCSEKTVAKKVFLSPKVAAELARK